MSIYCSLKRFLRFQEKDAIMFPRRYEAIKFFDMSERFFSKALKEEKINK